MMQEKIERLKRETEFAESQLLKSFKNLKPTRFNDNHSSIDPISNISVLKMSLPFVGIIAKLAFGKSSKVYSLTRSLGLFSKLFSEIK